MNIELIRTAAIASTFLSHRFLQAGQIGSFSSSRWLLIRMTSLFRQTPLLGWQRCGVWPAHLLDRLL